MIVFIEIVLLLLTISVNAEDVIVTTKYGQVRGFPIQTTGGHKANIFLGIPYAAPPVNELRFEKPTEPEPWEGVLNATEFAPTCLPHDRTAKNNHSSEDCLYLNIIAPSKENITANKSAVMIWIHGGAYCVGGAVQYGYTGITDNFVSRDILVVTIQYRLGPYGFLSDGTSEFAGNYGLWDQSAAIKFVKENIEAFGGDPEHITLFGSSAGGGSVDAHTISPHSNSFISMSGSALSPWAYGEEVVKVTKDLSNALNCTDTESKAVKSCLRAKTSDQIFDAVGPSRYGFNIAPYAPRIDGDFYPKELQKLVDEAPAKPTIIGLVEKEALVSDAMFNIPCLKMKELKMNNNWPVWFYFNIHYNPDAYTRDLPVKGATHLDEYPYLFDITPYKHFDLNEADRSVQKLLLDAFTSFAKNGLVIKVINRSVQELIEAAGKHS
uniref:Carboxylic ester hydrolase n=1 Tax=Syphacia muris TaxID=451379 RepID=A0A0N5AMU5_9BILA